MTPEELVATDKAHNWHPFTQMKDWCAPDHEPLVITEGNGCILTDQHGRTYIDGNSSIWTNIHGHSHPHIIRAIQDQAATLAHSSFLGFTNEPATILAQKLVALFPSNTLTRVFYTDDGSTAIEVALKMAVQFNQLVGHPEKSRFAAFDNAYHGDTAGASSLGGIGTFHGRRFAPINFPVSRINSIADLDALPSSERDALAAIIIEPLIQGAAGMRLWPQGLLSDLRRWCDDNEVFLILDEVMTGFGRTGKMFACEQENVIPDFIALAKGITGGTVPLAATLTSEKIYNAFLGEFSELKTLFYGHSYCGNPLACAAAIANLEVFEAENTLPRLQPKIALLAQLLADLKTASPHISDVRQCGFIAGIEITQSDGTPYPWQAQTGARICTAARKHGLLTRPVADTLVLMPPLSITKSELTHAVESLRLAIADICS